MHHTTDHDEIRGWIEERGGNPALVMSDTDKSGGETLTIIFPNTPAIEYKEVGWEEFFDIFDTVGLKFRYDDEVDKDDAEWAYGFEGADEPTGDADETTLPEDLDYVDENMFPSTPSSNK